MRTERTSLAVLLAATLSCLVYGQPGTNDATFNPGDVGNGLGDGPDGSVYAYAVLPDGKVIIGGYFTFVHGQTRGRIARLNSDGSLDLSFNPGVGFDNTVLAVVAQPDGKVIVGGEFTTCAGVGRNRIARLNADGSVDASFDPGSGFNYRVLTLAMQPDGKILVGGTFTQFNGAAHTKLVRLHNHGALDGSFSPGTIPGSIDVGIYSLALQGSGDVIGVGNFSSVGGTSRTGIARFSGTGSLDGTYPAAGVQVSEGRSCALQADGKLVIGAYFGIYATGFPPKLVARLNTDGSYDAGFSAPAFSYPPLTPNVAQVASRPDGKVIISGSFSLSGQRINMARLNTDGSLDPLFSGPTSGGIFALLPDSRIICGNAQNRLGPDGVRDPTYYPGHGCNSGVTCLLPQPDGRILVGGYFSRYAGTDARGLLRLEADGTRDPGFIADLPTPYPGSNSSGISDMVLQPDGKLLVVRLGVDRLNADGSVDPSFDDGTGGSNGSFPGCLALLPDGKILVGGDFTTYNGQPHSALVRLHPNGAVDGSFNTSGLGYVYDLAVQADGRIMVASGNTVVRLLMDGSEDPSFDQPVFTSEQFNSPVYVIELQPNGCILVGGALLSCNGEPRKGIARLHPDGTLDPSFDTSGPDGYIPWAIAVQSDGRILLAGDNTYYSSPRKGIARLNADGSPDATFATGTGFSYYAYSYTNVSALALQADGQVLAGGTFTNYNGTGRNRIARLNADGTAHVDLAAKVFLDGPYNPGTQLMNDGLRTSGLLLTEEPYATLGVEHVGNGATTMNPGVASVTGTNAVVDWIVVELRDRDDATNVLASRSALVQRDGDVVDVDGFSPLRFDAPSDNYYVSVRHRNHLGLLTAIPYALGPQVAGLDLTHPATSAYGVDARKPVGGRMTLWPGDVSFNGQVKYTGTSNDRDPILISVGSFTPNVTIAGYRQEDVNLDGIVKYTGAANDRDPILVTVGGTVPTNVRMAQLP